MRERTGGRLLQHREVRLPGSLRLLAPVAFLVVLGTGALGQTAGQVTPDTFVPAPLRSAGSVAFTGAPGLGAPPGAERFSILVGAVEIEGARPELEDAAQALRARLTRGRIPVAELFEAATEFEEAHAEAGFVLARVVLPEQVLRDGGRLRLVVVDGFVETVDISAADPRIRDRLSAVTLPLLDRTGLRLREIERQLLLAGDTYGVALGSTLAAGERDGGTVIVLDPDYRLLTGFVGADNSVSDALGAYSLDAGVELNGALGWGEVLYARVSGNPFESFLGESQLRTLAAGGVVPLGTRGLTFNLEATDSRTRPDQIAVDTVSVLERVSARLYYPWIRSRSRNLTSQLSLDRVRDTLDIDAAAGSLPVYEDRLTVLRVSTDGFWRSDAGATTEVGGTVSAGLDALGARGADAALPDRPLSRVGADADFRKLEIAARHRRALGQVAEMSLSGRAQTSFGDPLVLSEQIGIASIRELSAFPSGEFSGDTGWVVRGEVARGFDAQVAGRPLAVSPYLFAATGAVTLEAPQIGEQAEVTASAFGIGVDLAYTVDPAFSAGRLRLELGRGVRNDSEPDDTRFLFSASFRF
jgi:hemolysin activation/secretion protein